MKNKEFSPERKDRIKFIRGFAEGIVLLVLFVTIIKAFFTFTKYNPYDESSINKIKDNGFVVISYFGVDRNGTDTLISTDSLNNQLKTLYDNGYVTITQKDVLDYYYNDKVLPEKALLLLFEDGRRDTAIFAQKIMEKYNYKATMLTYADKFAKNDSKFLKPKDLLNLVSSTFWELGSNGYRLEYINVFDKDENYLGELTSNEFVDISDAIRRNYNHYLMDYIRDENDIPKESYSEMVKRIDYDYIKMKEIYTEELGEMPILYSLMHSNTGQFGTNNKVSKINEKWIPELFSINFNREGFSLNTKESSIYDLTRLQPQAYWSTNHLLMRIWDDTKKEPNFVIGDEEKAKNFQEIKGKAEFKEDTIILTSEPKNNGVIKLNKSDDYKNIKLSVDLKGNIIGSQGIYLRSDSNFSNYVSVKIINNTLKVIEGIDGQVVELYSKRIDENRFVNDIDIKEEGNSKLNIKLNENVINISLDDKIIIENLEIKNTKAGGVYLESAWGEYGYSQRNIVDDVYDAVFKNLKVTDLNDLVLHDSSLQGFELIKYNIKYGVKNIINWFITNL